MKRQTGQALPLGLFLMLAAVAVTFFMFNSGQLVQEKMRVTTTADAVAYSAGVFEARVLNYDAYANRAMIANEVAIGQAVAMASWAYYVQITAENLHTYLGWIPFVYLFTSTFENATILLEPVFKLNALAIVLHEGAIELLATSQHIMHGGGNAVALASRLKVMQEVAQKNDPDAVVDPLPITDDFAGFTERYSTREQRQRMGRLVSDSRDGFTTQRNWDLKDFLGHTPKVKVLGCDVGMDINKRGAAELIDLVDGWKAMDTVSLHDFSIRIRRFRISCRDSELPIGYATAMTHDDLDDSAYTYQGSRTTNPSASSAAESSTPEEYPVWSSSSSTGPGRIPQYYEIAKSVLDANPKDPRTTLAIRVTKARSAQRYSGGSAIVKPSGRLDLYEGKHAGSTSAALGKVEVYFERPDGKNKLLDSVEYGSLFNPYWQVRLAAPTSAERTQASARQGSPGLPE